MRHNRCDSCLLDTQYPEDEVALPPWPAFYCRGLATFGDLAPDLRPGPWQAQVREWIRQSMFNPKGEPIGRPSTCPGHVPNG